MRHILARGVAALATTSVLLAGGATAAQAQLWPPPLPEVRAAAGWGDNTYGQVGDGTFTDRRSPVNVYQMSGVKKVVAGHNHSLAVKLDGTLWAWGDNFYRQLGIVPNVPTYPYPSQVPITDVTDAAGGSTHSLAVRSNGTVWAWGNNQYGQLGDGTTASSFVPKQVPGLTNVVAVAAGLNFSLALRSDGTVFGWGDNSWGKLGTGVSGAYSTVPVRINGLSNVVAIAAGANHGMAVVAGTNGNRLVYTWGQNAAGQLGALGLCQGIVCGVPTPFQVPGLTDIVAIDAGGANSGAVGADGAVYTFGQTSHGNPISANPAVTVKRLPSHQGVSIAVGHYHVIVVRPDGTAVAWGNNGEGQLGNGTTQYGSTPTVVSLARVRQVAAGQFHSPAVYGQIPIFQ